MRRVRGLLQIGRVAGQAIWNGHRKIERSVAGLASCSGVSTEQLESAVKVAEGQRLLERCPGSYRVALGTVDLELPVRVPWILRTQRVDSAERACRNHQNRRVRDTAESLPAPT